MSWTATYSKLTLRQELYFFRLIEQLEKHEGTAPPTNDIMKIRRITFFRDTAVSLNTVPTSSRKPCGGRSSFGGRFGQARTFLLLTRLNQRWHLLFWGYLMYLPV